MKTLSHWPRLRGFVLAGLALGWLCTAALAQPFLIAEYRVDGGLPVAMSLVSSNGQPQFLEGEFTASVSATNFTVGPHYYEVRMQGTNGTWSNWQGKWFRVSGETHLTAAEWFVDTDPGYGFGTPIPLPVDGAWNEPEEDFVVSGVTVTNLTEGRHQLIIRAKDSNGDWGIPSQTTFYVAPPVTIVGAVWTTNMNDWGDPALTPPATNQMRAQDGAFDEESEDLVATVNTLALGTNYGMNLTLYLRCQDSLGRWSTRRGLYWDANAQIWSFEPTAGWQTNSVPQAVAAPVAFQGRVVDTNGAPVPGASAAAQVQELTVASTTTAADGSYTLTTLPPGVYVLNAAKAGWISDRRVVALSAATMGQNLQLRPLLSPPSLTVANSTPAFIPPPDGAQGSALRVFDGTAFVTNLALLDHAKMTVVLTHGWIPCDGPVEPTPMQDTNGWPLRLAVALESQGTRSVANIVAWDWHEVARPCLPLLGSLTPPPEEATPPQGIALGEALQQALGTDYRQKMHFIGNSLGTLVNGYAVDYLHGHQRAGHRVAAQPWLSTNTHVTISEDAAIARLIAKETLAKLLLSGRTAYASSVVLGWKNPVPHDFLWLDNYISSVGRYHLEAVNVLLQKGMLLALVDHSWFDAAVQAHGYPMMNWYPRTVTSPSRIMPGFGTSFEYALLHPGTDFPPLEPEFVPGIAFRQAEGSGDELALEMVTDLEPRLFYPAVSIVGAAGAEAISDWVETGLDEAASAGRRLGNVVVEVGQDVAVTVDQAVDRVVNGAGTFWDGMVDMLNRPNIRIRMQTGLPPGVRGIRQLQEGGDATNTPAAIWLPVSLPANVSILAFDFVVEGDGKDDSLVFGINGTNLFTLATKFIPAGVTNTSRFLDVSSYAGMTNELFFGILGGTSTNCTVRVEGIVFLVFSPLALAITSDTNGTTALSWPSTANGYALESAGNLSGGLWNEVTNMPALFGGRFTVTNNWADQTRFFRLRHR